MTQNLLGAGVFLIQTFAGLYLILLVLRFLMQLSRVDYYNPICQAIVKVTDPPVKPLKKILPTIRGIDVSTLCVTLIVQLLAISIVMFLGGYAFHPVYIAWSLVGLLSTIFKIYYFSLIIMVIVSWVAPYSNHPAMALVNQLTEPVCKPARKLLPPMGGMDFSIILVFVAITLIDSYLIIRPLAAMLGIPQGLVLGL
jgi:YggT family protein